MGRLQSCFSARIMIVSYERHLQGVRMRVDKRVTSCRVA